MKNQPKRDFEEVEAHQHFLELQSWILYNSGGSIHSRGDLRFNALVGPLGDINDFSFYISGRDWEKIRKSQYS